MKNLNIVLIIILFIIVIIILIYVFKFNVFKFNVQDKQYFINQSENIQFLSKEDTYNFLASDPDNYIHNFNQSDLIARKVNNIEEYLNKLSNSADSFTESEKEYLTEISQKANKQILNLNFPYSNELGNILFKFAKTKGRIYENGFPHTRKDIIFLATPFFSQNNAITTLIHEKVHLFQKNYPNFTHQYLKQNNYQYQGELSPSQKQQKRSNPDINNSIWSDPNGNHMLPLFKNKNPNSMNDIMTSEKNQHPYEAMAYQLELQMSQTGDGGSSLVR